MSKHPIADGAHRGRLLAAGWLTLPALSAQRGDADSVTTGAWVAAQARAGELIVLNGPTEHQPVIPTFQLTARGEPRPELRAVLAALHAGGVDGWASWTWLTSPSSYLSGDVPEQVAAFDSARVMRAAARFAAA